MSPVIDKYDIKKTWHLFNDTLPQDPF